MITTIKNDNSILYKDLFQKASEVLSGYERTQTFDENAKYFYKDSETNSFVPFNYSNGSEGTSKEEKLYEFANALTQYGYLYVSNGKTPSDYNFIPEIGITTLEEYYNWLPELKKDSEGKPTIFTKLPLDEAHFEINPNTRAILIPNEFKKNGIAVQGDDLAEVVYFMIDRYFDAMDLNNTEIYIEWETPKGPNGITKSVSETYLKMIDDENYPGKLIFGWAISDAITKDSGNLKFAVRFVQWNDEKKKVVYSFNTLTAQVTIHPNLGLDLENDEYDIDNCNDRLLNRIQHSIVVGGVKAAIPYYLQNLVILEDGYDIEDNHTTGTYDLSVIATASDTGVVSYVWKRADLDENNVCDDIWVEESGNLVMVPLIEEELIDMNYILPENHVYHLDNGDGSYQLLPKSCYDLKSVITEDWFKTKFGSEEIPTIYEQRSILTVEKYGMYKAEARNRIFNSLTAKESNVVIFKRPEPVAMDNTNQTEKGHIIGEDSDILSPVIVEEVGDLEYQWYRNLETIDSPEAKKLEYKANVPGIYQLHVVRTRNRATTEGDSIEYRVTYAPEVPTFVEDTYNGIKIYSVQGLEQGKEEISIEWEKDIESDYFHISWYLYRGDKGMEDLEIAKFTVSGETYESTFNPTEAKYTEIFKEAEENIEGYYYAIVKNELNDAKSEYTERPEQIDMFSVSGS